MRAHRALARSFSAGRKIVNTANSPVCRTRAHGERSAAAIRTHPAAHTAAKAAQPLEELPQITTPKPRPPGAGPLSARAARAGRKIANTANSLFCKPAPLRRAQRRSNSHSPRRRTHRRKGRAASRGTAANHNARATPTGRWPALTESGKENLENRSFPPIMTCCGQQRAVVSPPPAQPFSGPKNSRSIECSGMCLVSMGDASAKRRARSAVCA